MRRFGLTAAVVLALLISSLAFVYYGLPRFIKPELVRAQVLEPLEKWTAGSLTYGRFEFSYFPKFKVTFFDVRLQGSGVRSLEAHAERVEIEPDSFPLLIREFRVRQLRVEKATLEIKAAESDPVESVRLKNVMIEALPLGTLKAMRIHTKGQFSESDGDFESDLRLNVTGFSDWDWRETALQGFFQAASTDLAAFYESLKPRQSFRVQGGAAHTRLQFEKEKGFDWLSLNGDLQFKQFIYQIQPDKNPIVSEAMDGSFNFEGTVDPEKSQWALSRSSLKTPPGIVEVNGQGNYRTGEILDLRVSAPEIQLDQIPNYLVSVREAMPFNIGFSGLGQMELSLKGARDHLAVYLNTDLRSSVLTYGRFLDKPKGVPFLIVLDAVLKNGNLLNGDLSVRFNEVLAKGTLKNLDLQTGHAQLNLITNKHPVASWGPLVPMLKEIQLGGNMKFLTNWEGDLHDLAQVKKVFNLTVEDGSAQRSGEAALSQIRVELDYDSEMGLVIKQVNALVGESLLKGQVSLYSKGEQITVKTILTSPEVDFSETLSVLEEFFAEAPQVSSRIDKLQSWIAHLPPAAISGEDMAFEAAMNAGRWTVERYGLNTKGGRLNARGTFEPSGENLGYDVRFEIAKADLSFLFPSEGDEKICGGDLFMEGQIKGQASPEMALGESAQGSGNLLINKAEFRTFDFYEVLSRLPDFSGFKTNIKGKSRFEDIRGHFTISGGKFFSEDLLLLSPDFSMDAKGEWAEDGKLNLGLELYLARPLAAKVLGEVSGPAGLVEGEWFGPIPLIFAGTMAKPEIKIDSQLTGKLLTKVQRGNTQGAFRNFLREDALFEALEKN